MTFKKHKKQSGSDKRIENKVSIITDNNDNCKLYITNHARECYGLAWNNVDIYIDSEECLVGIKPVTQKEVDKNTYSVTNINVVYIEGVRKALELEVNGVEHVPFQWDEENMMLVVDVSDLKREKGQ